MTTLTLLPTTAFAKSYADQLRDKGFPESYISKLVSLHNKYPKWDFQPLKTGLNFTAAVKAERSPLPPITAVALPARTSPRKAPAGTLPLKTR